MSVLVERRSTERTPGHEPPRPSTDQRSGRPPVDELAVRVRHLSSTATLVTTDELGERQLLELLAVLRSGQRVLDLLVARVGARADVLAELGRCTPAREFLLGNGEVRGHTARSEAARAIVVARIPSLAEPASDAAGADRLDSLARRTKSLTEDQLNALAIEEFVAATVGLPADTFDAALRKAVEAVVADGGAASAERHREASEFRHWFDHRAGMGRFSGALDAERYEALVSAVDHHTAALAATAEEPAARNASLAAAALVDLVTSAGERGRHLPHVTVVVDEGTLLGGTHEGSIRQTGDGRELSEAAIARLCCDAILRRVLVDDRGVPVAVGRKYRTATEGQWAAIRAVYSSCGWHRCQRPLSHCQLHHVREWENGGATDLANLVPLCTEHHHRVHDGRWHIELRPDRSLLLRKPDGSHHNTTEPPTRVPVATGVPNLDN